MAATGKAKKRKYTKRMGADKPHERKVSKKKEVVVKAPDKPKRKYVHKSGFDSAPAQTQEKPKRKYTKKTDRPKLKLKLKTEISEKICKCKKSTISKEEFLKAFKKTQFYKKFMKLMGSNGKAIKLMIALNDLNLVFLSEFKEGN